MQVKAKAANKLLNGGRLCSITAIALWAAQPYGHNDAIKHVLSEVLPQRAIVQSMCRQSSCGSDFETQLKWAAWDKRGTCYNLQDTLIISLPPTVVMKHFFHSSQFAYY